MTIKITSDSTCDLSPELIDSYAIDLAPLYVTLGGKTYKDGVDIVPADIFSHVDAGGSISTTAAVSPADYTELFASLTADYDAVIHVTIGSGFSACYQNACLAAREFTNIYVVDSKNLSSGQGHIVVEAAKLAKAGLDPREICDKLDELTGRVEASFLLDRLDYMSKGGRCSAVAALGANLLRLKPCIEVIDGKMGVVRKYRGAFDKCIREYVKERLSGRGDIVYERIFITHPAADRSAIDAAREAIAEYADFAQVIETRAGCTISTHCGPNTLGVLFIRSK